MTVTPYLVLRIVFTALACIFAFFLFDTTDADIRPWLAVGTFGCTIGALFPWP